MRARSAAALLALAAAAPAAAYVRSTTDRGRPLSWPVPVVSYHESAAQAFLSPSCGPDATSGAALGAIRASFDAWRVSCSELDLVDAGPLDEIRTGEAVPSGTYENVVVFRQGWCSNNAAAIADPDHCLDDPDVSCGSRYDCFEDPAVEDRRTLALTSVLYYPDTGRIVDADVEMNAWDGQGAGGAISVGTAPPPHGWYFTCAKPAGSPQCATYGEADCYYADLQNTLTHEVGHFVGLRHVCYAGSPDDVDLPPCTAAYAQITMFPKTTPGDVAKQTLDADDVAGVCAIFPRTDGAGGGCGCGAGGAPGGAALLALLALWPRRRRPARAARDQATSTAA